MGNSSLCWCTTATEGQIVDSNFMSRKWGEEIVVTFVGKIYVWMHWCWTHTRCVSRRYFSYELLRPPQINVCTTLNAVGRHWDSVSWAPVRANARGWCRCKRVRTSTYVNVHKRTFPAQFSVVGWGTGRRWCGLALCWLPLIPKGRSEISHRLSLLVLEFDLYLQQSV